MRDSLLNGIAAGISFPVLFFFFVKGISFLLANYLLTDFGGFSLKLTCVIAVVSNVIPVQIFHWQGRGRSIKGIVLVTLILVALVLIYFKSAFF